MKPFIFAANWKMQLSFDQARSYAQENKQKFVELATEKNKIILCPPSEALQELCDLFKGTPVAVGAQDISAYKSGAYTGQMQAQSLKELGCTYCIIGHSERRNYNHETNQDIAHKAQQLIAVGITPIICIGENRDQYEKKQTHTVLSEQLVPLFDTLATAKQALIAYEPVWAIGTGLVPEISYLEEIFTWLNHQHTSRLPEVNIELLYGGSVNNTNAAKLASIRHLQGFLIGGASLDFQSFKNIVSLV